MAIGRRERPHLPAAARQLGPAHGNGETIKRDRPKKAKPNQTMTDKEILQNSESCGGTVCSCVFQIYWPAAREHVEHCRLAGKSLEVNFAKIN